MKLLLDENLSPTVAVRLRAEDGLDVVHVRDRGMLAATDAQVFDFAFSEDRVVVTINVDDFVRLAHARDVHAGLILFERAGLSRDEQLAEVRRAVAALGDRDLVNRVLWVRADGSCDIEDVPPVDAG